MPQVQQKPDSKSQIIAGTEREKLLARKELAKKELDSKTDAETRGAILLFIFVAVLVVLLSPFLTIPFSLIMGLLVCRLFAFVWEKSEAHHEKQYNIEIAALDEQLAAIDAQPAASAAQQMSALSVSNSALSTDDDKSLYPHAAKPSSSRPDANPEAQARIYPTLSFHSPKLAAADAGKSQSFSPK